MSHLAELVTHCRQSGICFALDASARVVLPAVRGRIETPTKAEHREAERLAQEHNAGLDRAEAQAEAARVREVEAAEKLRFRAARKAAKEERARIKAEEDEAARAAIFATREEAETVEAGEVITSAEGSADE